MLLGAVLLVFCGAWLLHCGVQLRWPQYFWKTVAMGIHVLLFVIDIAAAADGAQFFAAYVLYSTLGEHRLWRWRLERIVQRCTFV